MFVSELKNTLDQYHLLKHPFYNRWNEGALNRDIIKDYAAQYYFHVDAFPRYISATHSLCEDINNRKLLLENLMEEESFDHDHPKLWWQFAESLGAKHPSDATPEPFTQALIDNFFYWSRRSYAEGLGALYTYERQVPEVAEVKIEGLKKHYGVTDEKGLKFFEVHRTADKEHRLQCEALLEALSPEDQAKAKSAAEATAKHLWNFLSGIGTKHGICEEPVLH
ncbi:MAG: CADD family putative folate metabolism protein [Gammaproteobacteria bacterium]|nr:CADD family putative folate metabolism protein [Gammaproteobacteria bacterium]